MSGKILEYFKQLKEADKIGHAYMICNCDLKTIEEELNACFSECFFFKKVDLRNNEDILIIEPEKNAIKKEEILKIHNNMKITSQINECKIYIINECEKMNDYASNSLLKLLEEPEKNIYAFLISNNVDSVLKTIYSRCQILNFYNQDLDESFIQTQEQEFIDDAIKFVKILDKYKIKAIAHYTFISKKIKDREKLRDFYKLLLLIYRDILNIKLNKKIKNLLLKEEDLLKISERLDINDIVKYLDILSKYLNYIELNLNTNLLLDRFIIDVAGEK